MIKIYYIFKDEGLNIDIKCNLKSVDYLDVTFDLSNNTYRPFIKPNNKILYIHAESNHPPSVIKQIPKSISKRISNNSSSKEIFDNAAQVYNESLIKSGYKETLTYCPDEEEENTDNRKRRKNRTRKIIWFNPPYNKNVKTNVAKSIIYLIHKHFPKEHTYHKIFNKNNVKVSYGCLPNMKSIITKHNTEVAREKESNKRSCNCPSSQRENCPLDGNCYMENVVYKAEVSITGEGSPKFYIGCSKPPFKHRLAVHKKSFTCRSYNQTSLSEYVWKMKDEGKETKIRWNILKRTSGYNSVTKSCALCLSEKFLIATHPKETLINTKNELVNKCRHDKAFTLEGIT